MTRPRLDAAPVPAGLLVLLGLTALAACGSDSGTPAVPEPDEDGWVQIADGDTFGAWELAVQVEDDSWTGCLRLVHVDGTVEKCTEPDGAVVFANDVANVGATPTGEAVAFEDGGAVTTYGEELDLGFEFFVSATGVVDAATGAPLAVVGPRASLDDVAGEFQGRWTASADVVCTGEAPGVGGAQISSVEIDRQEVVVTSPCAGPDAASPSTCRAGYLLVGQQSDGDALEATLAPSGAECGGDDVWLSELALRVENDVLIVDDVTTFERA